MEEESHDKEEGGKVLVEAEEYGEENQPAFELTSDEAEHETRVLTRTEAGECLHNLGRCAAKCEYAYLSMDASDRGLTDISVIASFGHVRYVNVSGNKLTLEALRALEAMPCLQTLRADRNRLTSAELKPMQYLQVTPFVSSLNGGFDHRLPCTARLLSSRLTDTYGIRHSSLERLELNHNDIRAVTVDPRALVSLRTLELRGNALISTAGETRAGCLSSEIEDPSTRENLRLKGNGCREPLIEDDRRGLSERRRASRTVAQESGICCSSLTRLFLAENQIEKIEGLGELVNLKTLHLRGNRLASLDGFSERCRGLNYVNLRDNELPGISELRKLDRLPNLETLVVLGNPLLREEAEEKGEKEYRLIVLAMLPKLKRIDKELVLDRERHEAKSLFTKLQKSGSNFEDFNLRD
ncbi:PREDICTED: leucine-rich repeat-containing protein 23-like [Vollenhovia emeryi]|uniref:leucine-rich repeat-containing protein 23-like n=1 Tax=Vollenhovia emeryi TaxID=411798 RepID=UPI0005F3C317|nr:PREDICTED: leucine-rich repeat-containing protein 23-like [Vollenhovia emeryi]